MNYADYFLIPLMVLGIVVFGWFIEDFIKPIIKGNDKYPTKSIKPIKKEIPQWHCETTYNVSSLDHLKYCVLMVVDFSEGTKKVQYLYIVHRDDVSNMVDFFKEHHSDPAIDIRSGMRNLLVLEHIFIRSFHQHSDVWVTTPGYGCGSRQHKYPVDSAEIFSRDVEIKKEIDSDKKLAEIIPFKRNGDK